MCYARVVHLTILERLYLQLILFHRIFLDILLMLLFVSDRIGGERPTLSEGCSVDPTEDVPDTWRET